MENSKFEHKMALLARKHGLHLTWQNVKFGYRRAQIVCESREEMTAILNLLWHTRGIWTDCWCCFEGEFEGYVYAMNQKDREGFEKAQKDEMKRIEDWWMRYHTADAETRRLMACGKAE